MTIQPQEAHSPTQPEVQVLDPAWFRKVLGQYPTGVCVVTALDSAESPAVPVGMVVGSFTSVSLDPPLVAFLPASTSTTWPKVKASGAFCVNVLAAEQEDVCRAFMDGRKFTELAWTKAPSGSPVLEGAVAWIDCEIEAVHQAGDHDIVVGAVRDLDLQRPGLPLLFFQGGYGRFAPLSLASSDTRFAPQLHLVDRVRKLMEDTAHRTGTQVVLVHNDGVEQTTLASAGAARDSDARPQSIGQRLLVTPPIGVWWMAFAAPSLRTEWLGAIASPEQRGRFAEVLDEIRSDGCCLGLTSVPREQERERITALAIDPAGYVLSRRASGTPVSGLGDVVSVWAPTFDAAGAVDLGVMLIGFGRDDVPVTYYADEARALAADITAMAATA